MSEYLVERCMICDMYENKKKLVDVLKVVLQRKRLLNPAIYCMRYITHNIRRIADVLEGCEMLVSNNVCNGVLVDMMECLANVRARWMGDALFDVIYNDDYNKFVEMNMCYGDVFDVGRFDVWNMCIERASVFRMVLLLGSFNVFREIMCLYNIKKYFNNISERDRFVDEVCCVCGGDMNVLGMMRSVGYTFRDVFSEWSVSASADVVYWMLMMCGECGKICYERYMVLVGGMRCDVIEKYGLVCDARTLCDVGCGMCDSLVMFWMVKNILNMMVYKGVSCVGDSVEMGVMGNDVEYVRSVYDVCDCVRCEVVDGCEFVCDKLNGVYMCDGRWYVRIGVVDMCVEHGRFDMLVEMGVCLRDIDANVYRKLLWRGSDAGYDIAMANCDVVDFSVVGELMMCAAKGYSRRVREMLSVVRCKYGRCAAMDMLRCTHVVYDSIGQLACYREMCVFVMNM